jgi:hypothetical protein
MVRSGVWSGSRAITWSDIVRNRYKDPDPKGSVPRAHGALTQEENMQKEFVIHQCKEVFKSVRYRFWNNKALLQNLSDLKPSKQLTFSIHQHFLHRWWDSKIFNFLLI